MIVCRKKVGIETYDLGYFRWHTTHYLSQNLSQIPSFAWIKKELAVKPGEKVLDAGCGTGYLLDFVCGKQVKGVGIDISSAAIKTAKNLFPRHKLLVGDLTDLPFKKESFDKILCFNVIEHLKDQKKALSELHWVLKKNGVLLIGTNDKDSLSWRFFKLFYGGDPTHWHEFSAPEFIEFVKTKFKILKTTRSSCIARFPKFINQFLNLFLKGDILIKAKKL